MRVRTRTEVAAGLGDGRLEQLRAAHARRDRDRARGRPGRPDRRPSAHRVAAGRDRARRVGLRRHRPRRRRGWPLERPPLPLETSLPGVFAAGDVRSRSVKRVASAAGLGRTCRQRRAHLPRPGAGRSMARSPLTLVVLLALPLVGLAILLAAPETDVHWEHHPSHFWLVLVTAALNAVLAYATGVAARRRGDRRVHLVSLSFLAASGFLALHALATPGRPARQAESRLRDRDAGRARARRRIRGAVGDRQRAHSAQVPRACAARPAGSLGDRLPLVLPRGRRFGRPGAAVLRDGRALDRRRRLLRVRGRPLPRPLPGAALAARARLHRRLRAARGGDGRCRARPQLAGVVVGVAPADAARVRGDRRDGAPGGLGGALRPPLRRPRRAACDRPLRRPEGLHVLLRAQRAGDGLEDAGHALRSGDPGDRAPQRRRRPADRRRRLRHLRGREPRRAGRPRRARAAGGDGTRWRPSTPSGRASAPA